jgi:hypothetical protein
VLAHRASHATGEGRELSRDSFLLTRRDRVCARSERGVYRVQKARQPPGATESGAAAPTGGSGRGGGANAAESGGAAGSGGLPPTRKPERQRDRRDRERAAVSFAVEAECCGALSCRETEALVRVEQGGETRVLCADHARRWLR